MLNQNRDRRLRQLKSAERMFAPVAREALLAHMQERRGLVAACVMNCNRERRERFGFGDETLRIIRVRRIASTKAALAPAPFNSFAVFSSFSALRPAITTGCPARQKRRAMAAPNPRDAPTPTTSTLDCDGSLSFSFFSPSNCYSSGTPCVSSPNQIATIQTT